MDDTLEPDYRFQLDQLTNQPTMDLHVRVTEHKVEALLWFNGARYGMLGVRDEEPSAPRTNRNPPRVSARKYWG